MIQFIADMMSGLLNSINHFTGNYGLALVVFAAIIKLILYKPTLQMYRSQKDMEKIKPKMEELKKKHGEDPKKLNEELMKMYSENGVNPLAGCLPLFVQMPILFGIFRAITSNPDTYRSAYFLWIHPGTLQGLFPHYFASSLADADLAMVLFYGFMMLLSQKFTPSQGDPQQKVIGLYMSVFFTFMMWSTRWPCALILYWSSFQFFSVLQQVWILKVLAKPAPAKVQVIPAKA